MELKQLLSEEKNRKTLGIIIAIGGLIVLIKYPGEQLGVFALVAGVILYIGFESIMEQIQQTGNTNKEVKQ